MALAVAAFLAIDGYLVHKRIRYRDEIERLRAGMTDAERRRTDALVEAEGSRFRVMVELIRRQASVDKELNLAVSIDSATMHLQREGALLRDMHIDIGPERAVGVPPDTVRMVVPRGARTVERIVTAADGWSVPEWVFADRALPVPQERTIRGALGPVAVLLNGGTVIYSPPTTGPLNDTSYVLPGSIRATAADLRAIAPNLKPGMSVYFY
jgi:hypothetical protein